jgi:N-methylhydantoinase A
MGGTSTDVALIDREPCAGNQSEVAGFPVGVPMLDIHTVGAGGGSIARFDAGGALRVGPESAGADPGPICYGRGLQPTVTDANLILGRLRSENFLGGNFHLDEERTRRVMSQWLKKQQVKQSLEQFSGGVIRVVNATMEKAIRVVSIERGYDSRQFTLVAFGGAGGLHACELAHELRIPRVVVPPLPGALSAFGILVSDVVKDYSKTVLLRAKSELPVRALDREFAALRRKAERDFNAEGWASKIHQALSIDVRYSGQGYEINVPYDRRVIDSFREEHHRRYGYDYPDREVELVTVRLRASIPSSISTKSLSDLKKNAGRQKPQQARVIFPGGKLATTIWQRDHLPRSRRFPGPAIIAEYSATTVVPPRAVFRVDSAGNLVIEMRP